MSGFARCLLVCMRQTRGFYLQFSFFVWIVIIIALPLQPISRGRAAVARRAHNPKVGSSILPLATKVRREADF